LLDDTDLTLLDIAFAAGFGSLRQFNRTMREVFRASPSELRARRRRTDRIAADGGLALRLPTATGYDWTAALSFRAARAIPGVEVIDSDRYRRTITIAGAPGLIEIFPNGLDCLRLVAHLPFWEGLIHVVSRVSQLLGTDADGPALLPGAWNSFEADVRAILRGRDDLLTMFVAWLGTPVPGLPDGLTHTFPDPAEVTLDSLAPIGLPAADAAAIAALAGTVAHGALAGVHA
jgi:AraC family transcriptional regulator of adaptative response / DNA-3-methyladenine glycosylase II